MRSVNKNDIESLYFVTKVDSANIENTLLANRNVIFFELYEKSKMFTYKRKHMIICDTLKDRSFEMNDDFDLHLTGDKNKEKLIEKWVNTDKYYILPERVDKEHPDGSLDLAKAIDFYNSKDLDVYIDSLRKSYYKSYHENYYRTNPQDKPNIPYVSKIRKDYKF